MGPRAPMRFVLVGGIGYLGGRLARHLKSQGHHVAVTTRRPSSTVPSWIEADEIVSITDEADLRPHFQNRDLVVHLAAPNEIISLENPLEAIRAGGEGTWKILEALSAHTPRIPFIFLSTFRVYGPHVQGTIQETTPTAPAHPYALGRFLGESVTHYFRSKAGVSTLCVRLSNGFGAPCALDVPRWSLIFNDLCLQAVRDHQLVLKSPSEQRNFITLTDVARALEFLALNPARWPQDGLLHLGSSLHWSVLEAAERIQRCTEELLGYKPPIQIPSTPSIPKQTIHFSVERLAALGFQWQNNWEDEIKNTLRLCSSPNPIHL